MEYSREENFIFARKFLREGDIDNFGGHYTMLSEKEPDNGEAKFFSAYYAFMLFVEKNESVIGAVNAMTNSIESAVKSVKESECDEAEKIFVISKIVEYYTPIVDFLFKKRISTSKDTVIGCILGLYELGNTIKAEFGEAAMSLAIVPWKEGVALQRKYYANDYKGVKPEDYVPEIQKVDPSYTMPDKAGCITLG